MANGLRTSALPSKTTLTHFVGISEEGGLATTARVAAANIAAQLAGVKGPSYATRAELFADIAWADSVLGSVYGDSNAALNGIYKKSGGSGAGSWTRIGPLPQAEIGVIQSDITALDARVEVLESGPAPNLGPIQAEVDALETGITALDGRIDVLEAKPEVSLSINLRARPGDAYGIFTNDGSGGESSNFAALSSGIVQVNANGKAARLVGASETYPRSYYAVDPSRVYQVRYAFRRAVNSSDPLNDQVECRIAWYDQNKARLSGSSSDTLVQGFSSATVATGRVAHDATVAISGPVDVIVPAGAVYVRPYIKTYGGDPRTDIELIELRDITDLALFGPLRPNAWGALAGRAVYDAEPAGFIYLALDQADWQFFIRNGPSGTWSGPETFQPRQLWGTSSSAVAVGTGPKTFITQAGRRFDVGTFVLATSDADETVWMHGQVTAYSGTSLTINIASSNGSGSPSAWTLWSTGAGVPPDVIVAINATAAAAAGSASAAAASASSAAAIVGSGASTGTGSGAVPRSNQDINNEERRLLDLVPVVEHAGIYASTSSFNLSPAFQNTLVADYHTAGTNAASRRLMMPGGKPFFSTTLEIKTTAIVEGHSTGAAGAYGTIMLFPANTAGIRIHRHDTILLDKSAVSLVVGSTHAVGVYVRNQTAADSLRAIYLVAVAGPGTVASPLPDHQSGNDPSPRPDGYTFTYVAPYQAGDGTILRNLKLESSGGTNDAGHALQLRSRAVIQDVRIELFSGDGIFMNVTAGNPTREGNANLVHVMRGRISSCQGNGIFISGADVNACCFIHVDVSANRKIGIREGSFLGNLYISPHLNGNGDVPYPIWLPNEAIVATGSLLNSTRRGPPDHNGYWYAAVVSGTTGATPPVWPMVVGQQVDDGTARWECAGKYQGCSWLITGNSNRTTIVGGYVEGGQFPPVWNSAALIMGGILSSVDGDPDIVIQGDGSGAAAIVNVTAGAVAGAMIVAGGTGYTFATATIRSSVATDHARATVQLSGGKVVGITITHPGLGYSSGFPMIIQPAGGAGHMISPFAVQLRSEGGRYGNLVFCRLSDELITVMMREDTTSGFNLVYWDETNKCHTKRFNRSAVLEYVTSNLATAAFGRPTAVGGGKQAIIAPFIGASLGTARQLSNSTVIPTTGEAGQGDLLIKSNPSPGGKALMSCTTGGINGSTAVWKAAAVIDA